MVGKKAKKISKPKTQGKKGKQTQGMPPKSKAKASSNAAGAHSRKKQSNGAKEVPSSFVDFLSLGFRPVRVELIESTPPLEEPFAPIFVDLILNSKGERLGKWIAFGWQGYPNKRDVQCWPFLVDGKGNVDFGGGWTDSEERYGRTDLFEGPIELGRLVEFGTEAEGIWEYRIERLHWQDNLISQASPA